MKHYLIHMKVPCPDYDEKKTSPKKLDEIWAAATAEVKAAFRQAIADAIIKGDIVLASDQPDDKSMALSLAPGAVERLTAFFRELKEVEIIEAEYSGPPPLSEREGKQPKTEKAEQSSVDKMKRFME
jgi:hypothetical protein